MINSVLGMFNLKLMWVLPKGFQKHALRGKRDLVGAEIGVYMGGNALSLLKRSNIKKLYLIDPYELYDEYQFYGDLKLRKAKSTARRTLGKYNVVFIYKKSSDALKSIPKDLDFVYIDANHQYEYVKKDIENYWKHVKIGGVLGGHDVNNVGMGESPNAIGKQKKEPCGVIRAVAEFAMKNDLPVHIDGEDWWLVKGEKEMWERK